MNPGEVLSQARDTMSARRVFGEPIERGGVTIVPVARFVGGAGGGGGKEDAELGQAGSAAGGEGAGGGVPGLSGSAASFGIGFGVMAGPAGVYVIKGDQVSWLPAINVERLAVIGGITGFLVLMVLRSMLRIALRG